MPTHSLPRRSSTSTRLRSLACSWLTMTPAPSASSTSTTCCARVQPDSYPFLILPGAAACAMLAAGNNNMAMVHFTSNLRRHVDCASREAQGATVAEVLAQVFRDNERLAAYVLDEQGALRKHMTVLVDGRRIADRV